MLFLVSVKHGMAGEWGASVSVSARGRDDAAQQIADLNGWAKPEPYTSDTFRSRYTTQGRVFYRYIHVRRVKK